MVTRPPVVDDILLDNSSRCYSPERALIVAILERAFRDLHPRIEQHDRRDAVRWFKGYPCTNCLPNLEITFKQVAEILSLSTTQVRFIMHEVEKVDRPL